MTLEFHYAEYLVLDCCRVLSTFVNSRNTLLLKLDRDIDFTLVSRLEHAKLREPTRNIQNYLVVSRSDH